MTPAATQYNDWVGPTLAGPRPIKALTRTPLAQRASFVLTERDRAILATARAVTGNRPPSFFLHTTWHRLATHGVLGRARAGTHRDGISLIEQRTE